MLSRDTWSSRTAVLGFLGLVIDHLGAVPVAGLWNGVCYKPSFARIEISVQAVDGLAESMKKKTAFPSLTVNSYRRRSIIIYV